ncbi:MAG: tRNA adenosine(34) deaminase TadA [Thermoguttaceae bacterium]|jgi:tRNA(adenine34) deaminase
MDDAFTFPPDAPFLQWRPQDGDRDAFFMNLALREARIAAEEGEIPVGAALVCKDRAIALDHNRRESLCDPTAHAEILVIRAATPFFPSWRIEDSELFVTLEPCLMCAGAILQARVERLVFGAYDPKGGAVRSIYTLLEDPRLNWRCKVDGGVLEEECAETLRTFFRERRSKKTKT